MSEWGLRIASAMAGKGMSQTALAKECGLKPPSVNDWISGKTKMIDGLNLILAARVLGTTPEWIIFGKRGKAELPTSSHEIDTPQSRFPRPNPAIIRSAYKHALLGAGRDLNLTRAADASILADVYALIESGADPLAGKEASPELLAIVEKHSGKSNRGNHGKAARRKGQRANTQ